MPFCFAPWSNIEISEQGKLSPCCKFRHSEYGEAALDVNKNTVKQYQDSKVLLGVKQDFLNNRWPAGCVRCRIEEENNIKSKRILDQERWKQHYDSYQKEKNGYLTAGIALGNTCNLACVTCNAYSSSRWQREHQKLTGKSVLPIHYYKDNFVEEFLAECEDIVHIDFGGGEPFLTGKHQHHQLLERLVELGRAPYMSLHYTTNGTVWPDPELWKLLEQFDSVEIQFSLDGVGNRFEYIRYPAQWNSVQATVERYLNHPPRELQLSVSHTVSAMNVYYIDEFLNWCKQAGLPKPWLGRVHEPACLQPTVWPSNARELIVEKLMQSRHFESRRWAKLVKDNSSDQHFDDFCKRIRFYDNNRKTNFAKTFPELHKFVDK